MRAFAAGPSNSDVLTPPFTRFRIPDVEAVKKAIYRGVPITQMGSPGQGAATAFFDLAQAVIEFFEGVNCDEIGGAR